MSGVISRELSRRAIVKAGGAMLVGFSVGGAGLAGKAQAADSPFASNGPPDPSAVDSFLTIHADNTVSLRTGRVEMGQGSSVGLMMIAAEELDMDVSQFTFVVHDTNVSPDTGGTTGGTVGSTSISGAGPRVRSAAATAKQALLGLAAANLGVPVSGLTVVNGIVAGSGRSVTYGQLVGGKLVNVSMAAPSVNPGVAPSKPVSAYKLVGYARLPRVDIPAKVVGSHVYVHSIRVPGMLHGRLVRPRGQGSYGVGTATSIVSVDESSIKHLEGARVVRRNDFLGVVAPKEWIAVKAAAQLKVKYADPPDTFSSGNIFKAIRDLDAAGRTPARIVLGAGNFDTAYATAAVKLERSYRYQYNGHMPIGPTCAVADVTSDGALVMANTQDAYTLRANLQPVLNLPLNKIRVRYWEGSSSYGNGPAQYDGGLAAAVMSQLAGAPVRLQFMRWDEHGWDNFGPPLLADVRGGVDASGKIVAYEYTGFTPPAISQTADNPVHQHVGLPMGTLGVGPIDTLNSGSQYALPNRRIIGKTLPGDRFFKTSLLRSWNGAQTVFAMEQFVDELAYTAGMDPYELRLGNTPIETKPRSRATLITVGELANWKPRVANSVPQTGNIRAGRGLASACWGAAGAQSSVVADIELNMTTGQIRVLHLYAAQVTGMTVDLEGTESQMVGNLLMGTSRALLEQVAFDRRRQTSLDWVTYPILRFKDAPKISYKVVQRTEFAPTGAGEAAIAAVPAAIANAFFDATGVRIREAPLTRPRVLATLKAAGVA
jgi:CO/xanthine dehydrogenase Mo-binding subunit